MQMPTIIFFGYLSSDGLIWFSFYVSTSLRVIPFVLSTNGCKLVWKLEKIMKIDVQSASINLKIIQKEKIKQTKSFGYLWISVYVKLTYT